MKKSLMGIGKNLIIIIWGTWSACYDVKCKLTLDFEKRKIHRGGGGKVTLVIKKLSDTFLFFLPKGMTPKETK